MLNLAGTYECKMDDKGRLFVPSGLKKQLLPHIDEGFVLKRAVFQDCLELYPMSEWNAMMERFRKLNRFKKKNNDFIRRFMAGVRMVEVDSGGRLLVPKDLFDFAGLDKEVVLFASIDIIEIWDKTRYESAIEDAAGDFADLAEEVMGDNDDE